jgi:magnesium-transporting ATPase (P-type)
MITLKIDIMDTSKETKAIREQFINATDEELLTNIRMSKILCFLFSRNFFRGFLFIFMMLINLFYFSKTENEVRLLLNTLISIFLAFLITEFLNTDENAAIEKCTVETLRKMREELKSKQEI